MLAQVALMKQEPQAAIQYLRIETEHFPRNTEARMSLGNLLMRLGSWQEAAAEFADVLQRQPTHVEARRGRAQAFFNSGDYAMAEDLLAPLLASTPDDPLILLLQANILDKQGQPEKAKAVFDRAQKLREQTPPQTP
jgi:predicted Zn-dependent protease